MVKRWLTGLAVLGVVAMAAAGCGGSDSDGGSTSGGGGTTAKEDITIGLFVPSTTNDFWNTLTAGAREEAAKLGVKLIVQASTDDADASAGITKIQNLITNGAQGLVVVPLAPTYQPVLERALSQDIPVVCANSCIPDWDGQTSLIETNNVHAGELAGEYIKRLTGGSGVVGMLNCYAGIPSCDQRIDGAKSVLSGNKVVGELDVRCARELAVKATQNILTANPDLKVLYATCGQAALAASTTLRGRGHADVPVIGVDGVREEIEAILAGTMNATIAQFPAKMGSLGVDQAVKAIRGEATTKHIDSGEELVTRDNAQQFLADNFPEG